MSIFNSVQNEKGQVILFTPSSEFTVRLFWLIYQVNKVCLFQETTPDAGHLSCRKIDLLIGHLQYMYRSRTPPDWTSTIYAQIQDSSWLDIYSMCTDPVVFNLLNILSSFHTNWKYKTLLTASCNVKIRWRKWEVKETSNDSSYI